MFDEITLEEIKAGRKALLDGWGNRPNVILVKAQGAKVWDIEGKEYIDCTSQAWVNNIGACHPEVIEAVKEQIEKLCHAWYSWDTIPLLLFCRKLAKIARVAFTEGVIFGVSKYANMGHVLKIKPPLVITDEEVEIVLEVFKKSVSKVSNRLPI